MFKYQLINEILVATDDYSLEELRKLWYAELRVLHHAVVKEGYRKDQETIYEVETNE